MSPGCPPWCCYGHAPHRRDYPGFTYASQILFGGGPASSYTVVSDSVITAVVGPSCNPGSVSVFNITNHVVSLPGFIFLQGPNAPAITSFSPDSATTGTTVAIRGLNLTSVDTVSFGGTRKVVNIAGRLLIIL